MTMLRRIGFKD